MIKKIINLFIVIIIFWVSIVYAESTAVVYLESNKQELQIGNEVEISVNLENAKTVACNFSLFFDNSKMDYVSNIDNTNVIDNRIIFVWNDSKGGKEPKDKEIALFKFKAKTEGTATFVIKGEFYNENGNLIETTFKEKQIDIRRQESSIQKNNDEELSYEKTIANFNDNTNTNLETFAVQNYLLNIPFDNNTTNYKVEVGTNEEQLNILAIPENENAHVEITGNNNFKIGNNLVTITVTAEDGINKKDYYLEVYRRNKEEEANYEKEQEEMKDKLENAYEIEKLSSNIENNNTENKTNNSPIIWITIIIISVIALIGIVIWYLKRKDKK